MTTLKNMMGKAQYNQFLEDNYETLLEVVPQEVWVQFEREVPRDQRVFSEVEIENMNPTQTDKAIAEGRVPKGTSRTAGNTLWKYKKPSPK